MREPPHETSRRRSAKVGRTTLLAIVDSGPLLASANESDPDHAACVAALTRRDVELIIPSLCIAEAAWFLGQRHGAGAEARFVSGLADFHVAAPEPEDWARIGRLVRRYGELPLGTTDAFVAILAERMRTTRIITLDRRHFSVLRNSRGESFELSP